MTLLYFGIARDCAGVSGETISLDRDVTVTQLWDLLVERRPALAACRSLSRVAVDMHYAGENDLVPQGAEVAIIPPVAGG
ncbi:MAG: MoaD/ThiS family protein [Bacteroidetes bacterium]|nr:MoaD/ThiS family protein [Bacteroidota bacterium]